MIFAYATAHLIGLSLMSIIGQRLTPIQLNVRRLVAVFLLGLLLVWAARYTGLMESTSIKFKDLLIKMVMILVCVLAALEIELHVFSAYFKKRARNMDIA